MKLKLHLTLVLYALLATVPAYREVHRQVSAKLDVWAEKRVGMSRAEADEFTQIADAMPEYLKPPLPQVKP